MLHVHGHYQILRLCPSFIVYIYTFFLQLVQVKHGVVIVPTNVFVRMKLLVIQLTASAIVHLDIQVSFATPLSSLPSPPTIYTHQECM